MVSRSRESADRRLVTVSLTGDGSELVRRAYTDQHAQEEVLFSSLDDGDVKLLTEMLERVLVTPLQATERER